MNISSNLRTRTIRKLIDEIGDSMTAEGHDLPEDKIMATAKKQFNYIIY